MVLVLHLLGRARAAMLLVAATSVMQGVASAGVIAPTGQGGRHIISNSRNGGVIGQLGNITTIGSTVDPVNGDQNPYGLVIAPVTSGVITAGDLIVCNFNDGLQNIQGLGTTIELLHPMPSSKPMRLIQDPNLTGCNAISLEPDDDELWVASLVANVNPTVTSEGELEDIFAGHGLAGPWGQAFSGTRGIHGVAAFYVCNSADGSITRINIKRKDQYTFDKIATGFSVNHGVPGTILAPAGLTYDASHDVLYIVDSFANRIVAFSQPGMIPQNGIIVSGNGFGGPAAPSARIVYAGGPLRAPISSALLFNGDLVVGNTANNRLIEISPSLGVVGNKVLDQGPAGALFGIAASGTSVPTTKIYFNDDNDNTVKVLQP